MNPRTLTPTVLAAALAFTGCQKQDVPLTEAQQAVIRAEVLQAAKPMFAAFEKVDLDTALKLSQDGTDFELITADGKAYTYAGFKKDGAEFFASLSGQQLTRQKEKVLVLAPNAALYLWQGRYDVMPKDGTLVRSDPFAVTYLYRKIGGQWKFVYGHESGLPHQPVKP